MSLVMQQNQDTADIWNMLQQVHREKKRRKVIFLLQGIFVIFIF